jgi:hypothetical protein
MICIVGYPRTGTSILFKSLERAGFNGGDNLFGHKYKSQDRYLQNINRSIEVDWARFKRVLRSSKECVKTFFSGYCIEHSIDIVKDPMWWRVFNFWMTLCPDMRDHKFIWTKRDAEEAVESQKRVHDLINAPEVSLETGLEQHAQCERMLGIYMPRLQHIVVNLEDVLDNPIKEYKKISTFVGKEVSPALIDRARTYAENKEIN